MRAGACVWVEVASGWNIAQLGPSQIARPSRRRRVHCCPRPVTRMFAPRGGVG